jgi:hypothetical protein
MKILTSSDYTYMLKYVCIRAHAYKKMRERTPGPACVLFILRFNHLHKPAKFKILVVYNKNDGINNRRIF